MVGYQEENEVQYVQGLSISSEKIAGPFHWHKEALSAGLISGVKREDDPLFLECLVLALQSLLYFSCAPLHILPCSFPSLPAHSVLLMSLLVIFYKIWVKCEASCTTTGKGALSLPVQPLLAYLTALSVAVFYGTVMTKLYLLTHRSQITGTQSVLCVCVDFFWIYE